MYVYIIWTYVKAESYIYSFKVLLSSWLRAGEMQEMNCNTEFVLWSNWRWASDMKTPDGF